MLKTSLKDPNRARGTSRLLKYFSRRFASPSLGLTDAGFATAPSAMSNPPRIRSSRRRQKPSSPIAPVLSTIVRRGFIPVAALAAILGIRGVLDAPDASAKKQIPPIAFNELSREIRTDSTNAELEECFVTLSGEFPCNHGGSLVALPDGSLLCSWYAASSEAAPDAVILCSRLEKGSRGWTRPEPVVQPRAPVEGCWFPNKSLGDTVLFLDREGCVWLFFAGVTIGGWSASHVDFVTSHDFGRHWSPVRRLIGGFGQSPRSKLVELPDGKLMLPLSAWLFHWDGYTVSLTLNHGQILNKSSAAMIPGPENSQPSLVALNNRQVVAYLRNPRGGSVLFSKWNPALEQWSPANPVNLPSPDAAVDAIACENGVLMAYTSDQNHRFSMSVAWSPDGEHFSKLAELGDNAHVSVSYPTLVQSSDGDYHLIYTYAGRSMIKYLHLPQHWIRGLIAERSGEFSGVAQSNQ